MKAEILKILEMQSEGKLTRDQAAELLAMLADQVREKDGAAGTHAAPSGEAPGPRGGTQKERFNTASASAAIHGIVDTAVGIGATVGHAATVWGNEFLNMVHRDEGGNSVTLSKVDSPAGDAFSFRGNSVNVSKVAGLTLNQAEICGNNVNASKLAHLAITRGRFNQCDVNGSSVSHITIEGPATIVAEGQHTDIPATGIRGVIFNASKFSRVKLANSSALDACSFMASAVKDWDFADMASLRDSRINDSHVSGVRLTHASLTQASIERSNVQLLTVRDATLDRLSFSAIKATGLTIVGGTWQDVKLRRNPLGNGAGGRDCVVQDAVFENCTLTNCDFSGCTFRRTTLRNLSLAGISVRNIDFTGLTLETEEAFRRAAGL